MTPNKFLKTINQLKMNSNTRNMQIKIYLIMVGLMIISINLEHSHYI